MDGINSIIRPLEERDIAPARRILRIAFGTFVGAPDPENRRADIDFVEPRWRMDPSAAFAAEVNGEIVGSNFASLWGSFGFFGPLTVRPDLWDKGVGKQLVQPAMDCFERWQVTQAGLFTFAESAKHIALYQKFGFWPRFLTAIVSKPVQITPNDAIWSKYSHVPQAEREAILNTCYRLTNSIYAGLNLEREIRAIDAQRLGDTVLVWKAQELAGFAVCHCGSGTEAGDNKCYIKFGAAAPGSDSARNFGRLLHACEAFAASRGMSHIDAGVNLSRHEAYRQLLDHGFRTATQGVAMHRPNKSGHSIPGVYVIDDWR
jgi:predicted N-acetyltransferase YhbS